MTSDFDNAMSILFDLVVYGLLAYAWWFDDYWTWIAAQLVIVTVASLLLALVVILVCTKEKRPPVRRKPLWFAVYHTVSEVGLFVVLVLLGHPVLAAYNAIVHILVATYVHDQLSKTSSSS